MKSCTKTELRCVPKRTGRPADARDRGKSCRAERSDGARVQSLPAAGCQNAKAMVEVFLNRGYKVVSGGTENHLFLLDLVDKNLTGKEADAARAAPTSP